MDKLKKVILVAIALVPFNPLRIFLYRTLLGYDITYDCRIGPGNFLGFSSCRLRGARIDKLNYMQINRCEMEPGSEIRTLNKFIYVNQLRMDRDSVLVSKNAVTGSRPGESPFMDRQNMLIGAASIVTRKHSFDLADTVSIGNDVTFGGTGTEVWTHGFDLQHVRIQAPVIIGSHIYIGSRCLILQGVRIADGVSVGAGTIVSKPISEPGFYVSSYLMRKSDARDFSDDESIVEHESGRFVKK